MARGRKRRDQNASATEAPKRRSGKTSDGNQSSSSFNEQNGHTSAKTVSVKQNGTMNRQPSNSHLERSEREKIVLWRKPIITIYYALLQLLCKIWEFCLLPLTRNKKLVALSLCLAIISYYGYTAPGPHQRQIQSLEKTILWSAYWVMLGVCSSIGLGTGLHTFLIYLGPHIARVTLAAFECNSLDFPEPPYPEEVTCPVEAASGAISLWSIINKVRLECFMWGAGTALGELPPYFMARAARLSGREPDNEEYAEVITQLEREKAGKPEDATLLDRLKLWVEKKVVQAGFFGILLCASIPNPLFDLAGIVCGHSLISFWTFFGATLIGKAIIKAHLQMVFVIFAFSEQHVDDLINVVKTVPKIGATIERLFRGVLNEQKRKLHRNPNDTFTEPAISLIQHFISWMVFLMIVGFVVSIINSLAQAYHKRVCKEKAKSTKRLE
ncbi:Ectopic P granules protein 3 [Aphelenchoides besseyi]|nr:Ectopic P granules protein 3 [Aphelenchoides besseyi]KAI6235472.1 Ectopic P granules protein 3 [Aphelenchoides besseyi]